LSITTQHIQERLSVAHIEAIVGSAGVNLTNPRCHDYGIDGTLAVLAIIAGRLKMLPPGARDRGHSGTTDFAWFIMRREIVQATRLVRG
jgi:hypothetical protein